MSDFFDPTPEDQNVVLIDAATLHKAEKLVVCCEGCNPVDAELPFNCVLDRVTSNVHITGYIRWSVRRSARSANGDQRKDAGQGEASRTRITR